MVFNKEKIEKIIWKFKNNKKITRTENIFFQKDIDLRKENIKYIFSKNEINEYAKCFNSIEYFIESNFNIKLFDFQKEIIKHYQENRFQIYARSYHIGFSNLMSMIYLWELCFKTDFTITFIGHKNKDTIEMMENFKKNYKKLSFFLKPGIKSWNIKNITFDNYNRFICGSSSQIAIGYSTNILHINDFALMSKKKQEYIYSMYIPIISARTDDKLLISSVFNGNDFFYSLYSNSLLNKNHPNSNMYESLRLPYNVVSGRDDEWKENEIKLMGGDDNAIILFEERYNMRFMSIRERKLMRILK